MSRPGSLLNVVLAPTVRIKKTSTGRWTVLSSGRVLTLTVTPGVESAFCSLATEGTTEDALAQRVYEQDGPAALPLWYDCMSLLRRSNCLHYRLREGSETILRLIPRVSDFVPGTRSHEFHNPLVLSRFAYLHREGRLFVLESPASLCKIEIVNPQGIEIISAFSRPVTPSRLACQKEVSADLLNSLVALLLDCGFLTCVDAKGRTSEDESTALGAWDFAGPVFHTYSRLPRLQAAPDDQSRTESTAAHLPALKEPMSQHCIELERPVLSEVAAQDPPFTQVLEGRRSLRSYGATPLEQRQLAEFVYRTVRVQKLVPADDDSRRYESTRRPYPSGGACCSLEVYLAVDSCSGLARGLYHYDPLHHRLEVLPHKSEDLAQLLRDAQRASRTQSVPPVLFILTARFRRVMDKYGSVAYSLILKEVGSVFQTMYLVATAMGLAPCALGGGDSDRFARMIGSDRFEESSVGEFMLGPAENR